MGRRAPAGRRLADPPDPDQTGLQIRSRLPIPPIMSTAEESQPARHNLRIPFNLQILFGSRKFFTGFSLVMALFFLYGPLPANRADHNAYRYLLGPLASALAGLAVAWIFPFNPYRWNRPSERSLSHLDDRDEDAHRFVEILRSPECRRREAVAAAVFALVVSAALGIVSLGLRGSLDWAVRSPWLVPGLGGGILFAWIFIKVQTISWALMTWWDENGRKQLA